MLKSKSYCKKTFTDSFQSFLKLLKIPQAEMVAIFMKYKFSAQSNVINGFSTGHGVHKKQFT